MLNVDFFNILFRKRKTQTIEYGYNGHPSAKEMLEKHMCDKAVLCAVSQTSISNSFCKPFIAYIILKDETRL